MFQIGPQPDEIVTFSIGLCVPGLQRSRSDFNVPDPREDPGGSESL